MHIAIASIVPIIAITVLGDYFIKLASQTGGFTAPSFYIGALFYAASAVGLLIAMQHMKLATVGVWYSILTILAMTALGVLAFEERLSPREVLGIAMAFGSLACMSKFA